MTLLSVLSSPSAPTRCFAVGVEGEYWPRDRELLQGQLLGHLPEEEDMGTREGTSAHLHPSPWQPSSRPREQVPCGETGFPRAAVAGEASTPGCPCAP